MPQKSKHMPKELRQYLRLEYQARRMSRADMMSIYGFNKYVCEKVISKLFRWDRIQVPPEQIAEYCKQYEHRIKTRKQILAEIKEGHRNIKLNNIDTWLRKRGIKIWDKIYRNRDTCGGVIKKNKWRFVPFDKDEKLHDPKRYEMLILNYNK